MTQAVRLVALGSICAALLVVPSLWLVSGDLRIFSPAKDAALATLGLVLLVLVPLDRAGSQRRLRPADTAEILLLFFLLWSAVAISIAVNRHEAWQTLLQWVGAAGAFWFVRRTAARKAVIASLAGGLGLALLFGYLQLVGIGLPMVADQYGEVLPTATFGQANFAAQAMIPLAVGGLMLAVRVREARVAGVYGLLGMTAGVYIWLTESRGALLAVIVGMAVGLIGAVASAESAVRRRALALAGTGTAALLAALATDATWRARLGNVFTLGDGAVTVRVHLWLDSLKALLASPLFGFGPGQFLYRFPEVWSKDTAWAVFSGGTHLAENPHNDWLAFALDAGLPAFLVLVGFAVVVTRRGWFEACRDDARKPWFWAGISSLAAWAAYAFIDYPLHNAVPLLATGVSAGLLSPRHRADDPVARHRRLPAAAALAACVVAAIMVPRTIVRPQAQAMAMRAKIALEAEPQEARILAEAAVGRDATNALAHSILGQAMLLEGLHGEPVDFDGAIGHLETALAFYPVDFVTRYNLGVALYQQALSTRAPLGQARRAFEQVSTLNPWYARAWYMQASLDAREGGPWARVGAHLEKALRHEPALAGVAAVAPEFEPYRALGDPWETTLLNAAEGTEHP